MKIKFLKMNVFGNDFILINNFNGEINKFDKSKLAKKLCDRYFSIGADGLILLEKATSSLREWTQVTCPDGLTSFERGKIENVKMSYYNCDGSKAEMCGNGIRCLAYFAKLSGLCGEFLSIETDSGTYLCEIKVKNVKLYIPNSDNSIKELAVKIKNKTYKLNYIIVGVPHCVIFTDEIEKVNVKEIGHIIRFHEKFKPQGTNVDFVRIKSKNELIFRTYERGVEDETYSCGTGAIACAIVSYFKNKLVSPISCFTLNGGKYIVHIDKEIALESEVNINFFGEVEVEDV